MKKIISFLTIVTLLFAVVGCSGDKKISDESNGGETKANVASNDKVDSSEEIKESEHMDITIAIEATGDIPQEFEKQIMRFNESRENITVKILTYSGAEAYKMAIMGQIAGHTAPDVFLLDGGKKIEEYARLEVIKNLDGKFDTIENFEQSLVSAFEYDGSLYGVPKDYNTSVLFYHKNILEDAGLEVPTTMDEFKEVVRAVTTSEIVGFGADCKINYLYPFAETMGADFVGAGGVIDKDKLTSNEHIEMLAMLKNLYDNDYATSPYLAGAGWDGELFGNQKVALLYGGSWITGVIEDTSTSGVAPLPVKGGPSSMLYVAGWVVADSTKNEDAAIDLIGFLTSDEELVAGNQVGLIGLPPTKSAMDKLIESENENPFLPVYKEVVKDGVPFGSLDAEFVDAYNKELEKLIYSDSTPEKMVENLAKALD